MDYTFIIKYKKIGYSEEHLGKLQASCWSEAMDKAKNILDFIESKLNQKYELIDATNLFTIEDWDN
jgi:hypothetical protein